MSERQIEKSQLQVKFMKRLNQLAFSLLLNVSSLPNTMRPTNSQPSTFTSSKTTHYSQYITPKQDSTQSHSIETYYTNEDSVLDEQMDEQDLIKNETFYEHTQGEQKIWRLFKSLDCQECEKMYNNKDRKPHIICANNHLLCKSCYLKARQTSLLCPKCHVRMNTKNTSSHQSIQLFLKIYNEIFQKQKCLIQQKRKRTYLDFEIPKNIKTISVLLLIIVTPWIYDALKFIVCFIVDLEYRLVIFLLEQVEEVVAMVRVIVEDQFYIGLYTNERGEYVYHGEEFVAQVFSGGDVQANSSFIASAASMFTDRHKAKIQFYLKFLYFGGFVWDKLAKIFRFVYQMLRLLNYTLHFITLLAGLVQFPFLIPFMLFRVEIFVPRRYRYRIGLYLDIVEEDNTDEYIDPEDIERLSKGQLYFLLFVRNYIRTVLQLYRSIEVDMKKRCEDLEYKKRMRLLKKSQKDTTTPAKPIKRFTF